MNIKDQIKFAVAKTVADKNLEFNIEAPSEKAHGDYATNVALVLAKKKSS